MKLNIEEKWLGNWASAILFSKIVYDFWYDDDGWPIDTPEWIHIRFREIQNTISSYEGVA